MQVDFIQNVSMRSTRIAALIARSKTACKVPTIASAIRLNYLCHMKRKSVWKKLIIQILLNI